jgi:hypothetical protein
LVEKHPEKLAEGVVRADGTTTPFNAGDAIAAVAEMYAMPIPSRIKARLGASAKQLLADGFQPNVVCSAMLMAVKMARPHLMESFALEMQTAASGQLIGFPEYRAALQKLNADNRPELQSLYQALEEALQ